MNAAGLTELGRALGCTIESGAPRAPRGRALPEEKYYAGRDLFIVPAPSAPRDETGAPTWMEREARELRLRGRDDIIRFVCGRYSARLHRVVRPA